MKLMIRQSTVSGGRLIMQITCRKGECFKVYIIEESYNNMTKQTAVNHEDKTSALNNNSY